ncbi:hypothetical protein POM88_050500 [Heracleum sosnowskyi]|uniref:Uncharacterized protein n=1 Tax=Heracleum sosnowskyi TaxID=360622 RepID=A0AAD8M2F6_9APIA|nr:hypothetical protein POM88_050500 [Heracleum sosnowskyi]
MVTFKFNLTYRNLTIVAACMHCRMSIMLLPKCCLSFGLARITPIFRKIPVYLVKLTSDRFYQRSVLLVLQPLYRSKRGTTYPKVLGVQFHSIYILNLISFSDDLVTAGPRKFSYQSLAVATYNFSDERMFGEGGFGCGYKG